jgi:hypothetical protein
LSAQPDGGVCGAGTTDIGSDDAETALVGASDAGCSFALVLQGGDGLGRGSDLSAQPSGGVCGAGTTDIGCDDAETALVGASDTGCSFALVLQGGDGLGRGSDLSAQPSGGVCGAGTTDIGCDDAETALVGASDGHR